MTYLVDANVLSEGTKPHPAPKVLEWLRRHEAEFAVDPIILGEIEFSILLLQTGQRRCRLERWFTEGVRRVHCLPWDSATGRRWARLLADLRKAGAAMPVKDSMIAATALVHDLTMVTHNTRDFEKAGLRILDPFA
jgi:hypothetical protein